MMIDIIFADFSNPQLRTFLQEHLDDIEPTAPPESRHALDYEKLQVPEVRMWTAVDGEEIVGTIAVKNLEPGHEEIKSMRTAPSRRGEGIGGKLVTHALADARQRGITRISLETGSMEFFDSARRLYRQYGFEECGPYGTYVMDPNSYFMTLRLTQ